MASSCPKQAARPPIEYGGLVWTGNSDAIKPRFHCLNSRRALHHVFVASPPLSIDSTTAGETPQLLPRLRSFLLSSATAKRRSLRANSLGLPFLNTGFAC